MFNVGDTVKYSKDFILEAFTRSVERIYANEWRGTIGMVYEDGSYEVDGPAGDNFTMEENDLEGV